jgi:hypothetical protein
MVIGLMYVQNTYTFVQKVYVVRGKFFPAGNQAVEKNQSDLDSKLAL